MSPALVIRADSGIRMGTGHVMRCIALGQAWRESGGRVVFATAQGDAGIRQRLDAEGWQVADIAQGHPSKDDIETTLRLLADTADEAPRVWLACDGYHFDAAFCGAVRERGYRLLAVDDYNHLPFYDCDVLLNQNVSAPSFDYQCSGDCVRLLGPSYALLRREFLSRARDAAKTDANELRILVTLGGSDPDNVTYMIMKGLEEITGNRPLAIRVVLGAANPHFDSIRDLVHESNCKFELLTAVSDMPALMQWADLAISAGGSTCWELCYLGVPSVLVSIAENQDSIVNGLAASGAAVSLGDAASLTQGRVRSLVEEVLGRPEAMLDLGVRASTLVDGLGAGRVVETMRCMS